MVGPQHPNVHEIKTAPAPALAAAQGATFSAQVLLHASLESLNCQVAAAVPLPAGVWLVGSPASTRRRRPPEGEGPPRPRSAVAAAAVNQYGRSTTIHSTIYKTVQWTEVSGYTVFPLSQIRVHRTSGTDSERTRVNRRTRASGRQLTGTESAGEGRLQQLALPRFCGTGTWYRDAWMLSWASRPTPLPLALAR